jgi:uncharacterized phage protein (TIGR02218 family)
MPRTIPVNVQTHLNSDYQTLAFCVKLTRADTTVMGFTSHDKDLTFGSVTYEAASALDASAVRSSIGTGSTDNFEMMGLLQSDKIDAEDLRNGLYDGAEVIGSLVNWASVGDGAVVLLKGHIGNITIKDEIFTCEFRSLSQAYNNQIVEVTTPLCRVAKLGDARCGITLATYQNDETIETVTDSHTVKFSDGTVVAAGYYTYGRVIWLTGDNAGFVTAIKEHTLSSGNALSFQEAPPYTVQAGDTATLEAGCDRRIETCAARFSNAVNFRGEPYLPGNSTVMTSARS